MPMCRPSTGAVSAREAPDGSCLARREYAASRAFDVEAAQLLDVPHAQVSAVLPLSVGIVGVALTFDPPGGTQRLAQHRS